jgi:hypothetical protein
MVFRPSPGNMRVRITKQPPPTYQFAGDSLLVGRVYNLDASFAAALMLEGCAESYDLLSPSEKREFRSGKPATLWKAANRLGPFRDPSDDPDPTA